ncbi:MAG: hypothetical protein ACI8Q1_000798 [Parvicella sp.]|jgi:hypothetical protein
MKRIAMIFCLFCSLGITTQAQVNPHAIGLRFGGNGNTNGAQVTYQHGVSSINRFELDLGFRGRKYYSDMFVSGTYQWVWNITDNLNWYIGPGAALGFYDWDDGKTRSSGINLGIGGQIGIEYDFNPLGAPILVSIDSRPMFDFIGYDSGFGWGRALSVRYTW